MGSILRTCAALGISDIFLGPECVDPFARRVLRVSMGNAFKLRFYEVSRPLELLRRFEDLGIESISACLSDDSEELSTFHRRGDSVLLLGNEARGLPKEIQYRTNRRLEIGMDLSTDSLNVSVAAGIILHNLCRIC
jgi:tRNA G18 (ribose-2'-O)-methylase SpoU